MNNFNQEIDRILEEIRTKNQFVLTSHINPDGDGLGSELALYYMLKQQNKDVRIINDAPVPGTYQFLDPEGTIFTQYDDTCREFIINADVIFVLDISEMHRLGAVRKAIEKSSAVRICIDHHSKNNFDGDLFFINETAVATGELVTRLIKRGGFQITAEIAEALYTALLTDTGCFRFTNTNASAHRLGAELLDLGVNHQEVYRKIFENNSWEKTRLFARTLSTLEQAAEGKIAIMHITKEMMKQSCAAYEDIEGFSEYPRNIKGVLISILFVEQPDNDIKISFRSSGEVAVDALAAEFDGGGHKNASASVFHNISLSEAKEKVIDVANRYVEAY